MKQSESIASLASALIAAQAEIKTIGFDSVNPFFKSKYASLTTILETVRPILARHKLAIVQGATTPHTDHNGHLTAVSVESTLIHASGEWITSGVIMPVGVTPIEKGSDVRMPTAQTAGGAVSFGRRYSVAALLALATDEDVDGNDTALSPETVAQIHSRPVSTKSAPSPVARPAAIPQSGASNTEPSCPVCHGKMWDNREGKKNPKAPDFKCRDKSCDGVVWPPKNAPVTTPAEPERDYSDFEDSLPF